ncbi:hypothetical protein LMH81_29085, partial [Vibrio lentus]|uniref:hypothetical protein n=1 Tax=Vibrio lentus TaxID=136468 RepID=UPI001E34431F
ALSCLLHSHVKIGVMLEHPALLLIDSRYWDIFKQLNNDALSFDEDDVAMHLILITVWVVYHSAHHGTHPAF